MPIMTLPSDFINFIKRIPYFNTIAPEKMVSVAEATIERSFSKGEMLFFEGEECDGLYLVKTGRIRIFKSSPEGREQVLMTVAEGESFNEVPVFDGGLNPASASAMTPATVYIVPKETMQSLLAECPAGQTIIQLLASRLRHLTSVVEDLSFRSVVSRLARLLLDIAVEQESGRPVPRLTQEEMATRIGSVRDVVGRGLRSLERQGAIKLDGQRILVIDADKLKDAK